MVECHVRILMSSNDDHSSGNEDIYTNFTMSYETRVTWNAEITPAAQISILAEGWDCETVGAVKVKQARYMQLSHG